MCTGACIIIIHHVNVCTYTCIHVHACVSLYQCLMFIVQSSTMYMYAYTMLATIITGHIIIYSERREEGRKGGREGGREGGGKV